MAYTVSDFAWYLNKVDERKLRQAACIRRDFGSEENDSKDFS